MSGRIVFDLDGTLIDSARDIQSIANAVLAEAGVPPVTLEQTRGFIGEGIHVFVSKMRAARGIPDSEQDWMLAGVVSRYDDAVGQTESYPGVVEVLKTLSEKHRLGICTNKLHRPCVSVLTHLNIDHFFESVWGGDNPLGRKPDPAPLLAVFKELGDGPMAYVGDSEIDAETAQRAGVPFFLFTEGYRKAPVSNIPHTAAFDNFSDLPGLLTQHISAPL